MVRRGARNEAIGALLALFIGLVAGVAMAPFYGPTMIQASWATAPLDSDAILVRGSPSSLLTGLFLAVPSGAAIALAMCQGGVSGLIGAAISASLLPPLVNAGLCFGVACTWTLSHDPAAPRFRQLAHMSLALYATNLGVIIATALLVFRWKRVDRHARDYIGIRGMVEQHGRMAAAAATHRGAPAAADATGVPASPLAHRQPLLAGAARAGSSGALQPLADVPVCADEAAAPQSAPLERTASPLAEGVRSGASPHAPERATDGTGRQEGWSLARSALARSALSALQRPNSSTGTPLLVTWDQPVSDGTQFSASGRLSGGVFDSQV